MLSHQQLLIPPIGNVLPTQTSATIFLVSDELARVQEVASVLEWALTLESIALSWNLPFAIKCLTLGAVIKTFR